MSESAANLWKRLRLCSRLLRIAAIASLIAFLLSMVMSLVVFSPFNSLVIAISGGGVAVSGNTAGSGSASETVSGPIQVHLLEGSQRFAAMSFSTVWHDIGFRQVNIPIYFIFVIFAVLAVVTGRKTDAAAKHADLCHHCGYVRGAGLPARCPECGHTARL